MSTIVRICSTCRALPRRTRRTASSLRQEPDDRFDDAEERAGTAAESNQRYQQLLDQGWTDSLRKLHPDEAIYTFWDYFRQHWQKNSGLRIDHLLVNKKLAPKLKDAGVDRWVRGLEKASDHAPTSITVDHQSRGSRA